MLIKRMFKNRNDLNLIISKGLLLLIYENERKKS